MNFYNRGRKALIFLSILLITSTSWSKGEDILKFSLDMAKEHECDLEFYKLARPVLSPGIERNTLMVNTLEAEEESFSSAIKSLDEETKLVGVITTLKSVKDLLRLCRIKIHQTVLNSKDLKLRLQLYNDPISPEIDALTPISGDMENYFLSVHKQLKTHHQKLITSALEKIRTEDKYIVATNFFKNTETELETRIAFYIKEFFLRANSTLKTDLIKWLLSDSKLSSQDFIFHLLACDEITSTDEVYSLIDDLNYAMVLRKFRSILRYRILQMEWFFAIRSGRGITTKAEKDLYAFLKRVVQINFRNFSAQLYSFADAVPAASASCSIVKNEIAKNIANPYKAKKWIIGN